MGGSMASPLTSGSQCLAGALECSVSRLTLPTSFPPPAPLQILTVAFSEGGDQIYTAGIENAVNVWDLRREEISMSLTGHSDSITGMRVSPDGSHLLTNSMDNTLRCAACTGCWPAGGGV